jgi:hypothetical protein
VNLEKLGEPFKPTDIEWRVQQSGVKDNKVWATVVAYVTNRAIMERLDEVVGPGNWQNEFKEWGLGTPGVLCGLSVKIGDQWVTKWDGAEQPADKGGQLMAVKGGFSNAMKRAAVLWGIGRYLYDLPAGFANIHDKGKHRQPETKARREGQSPTPAFKWDPPQLPKWALPEAKDAA